MKTYSKDSKTYWQFNGFEKFLLWFIPILAVISILMSFGSSTEDLMLAIVVYTSTAVVCGIGLSAASRDHYDSADTMAKVACIWAYCYFALTIVGIWSLLAG